MKYIKKFNTLEEQTAYLAEADIDTYLGYVDENNTVYYEDAIPIHDYSKDYFTIESLEDNNTIELVNNNANPITLSASTDNGETWTEYITTTNGTTTFAVLNTGDKLLLKGINDATANGNSSYHAFGSGGPFESYGNIMSLLKGDNFQTDNVFNRRYTFLKLFNGSSIVSADNLILPATDLIGSCYRQMFGSCENLTIAPTLPAATLDTASYRQMFTNCTNLNHVKCLATDISANDATTNWLSGVASTGTFVKAASMNGWTTGDSGIPTGWTIENA